MSARQAIVLFSIVLVAANVAAQTQTFNDYRCKCLCPHMPELNGTQNMYIGDVPPNRCNCEEVILPKVPKNLESKALEICVRCDCKYENRNTAIIKVVVIIVIWIISLLVVYMLFLICLDPLLNKRIQSNYTEHTNEDDMSGGEGVSHAMGVRSNVLNRVGHQQDKWKRQVREQRRNIYDRHTMLN